jgi:hypothetical protein
MNFATWWNGKHRYQFIVYYEMEMIPILCEMELILSQRPPNHLHNHM